MKSSLLLKDKSGKPFGYILVKPDGIICKAGSSVGSENEEIALILKDQSGACRQFSIAADGAEHEIRDRSVQHLNAACIRSGRRTVLSTDWNVSFSPEDLLEEKSFLDEEKPVEPGTGTCTTAIAAQAWPQLRWPRPVCWPKAKYAGGAWVDES